MFGRKQAKIVDLEFELRKAKLYIDKLEHDLDEAHLERDDANRTLRYRGDAIFKLTADLRQMDQFIFRMSQCPDWSSMRHIFNEVLELTQVRMSEESQRIRAKLVPEILQTYTNAPTGNGSAALLPKVKP